MGGEEYGHKMQNLTSGATDTAGAAAGPGATATHAMPENVTTTEGLAQKETGSDSRASSQDVDSDKPHDEEKGPPQPSVPPDGPVERSKGKIAVIMLALCMAVFLAALDVTIVTTALPTISEHFGSASGYTWIGSAFLLANSASIPSWGKVLAVYTRLSLTTSN